MPLGESDLPHDFEVEVGPDFKHLNLVVIAQGDMLSPKRHFSQVTLKVRDVRELETRFRGRLCTSVKLPVLELGEDQPMIRLDAADLKSLGARDVAASQEECAFDLALFPVDLPHLESVFSPLEGIEDVWSFGASLNKSSPAKGVCDLAIVEIVYEGKSCCRVIKILGVRLLEEDYERSLVTN